MILSVIVRLLDLIQTGRLPSFGLLGGTRKEAFRGSRLSGSIPDRSAPVWFHASSLGELEMLVPLMEDFESRGIRFCVSAFSESAIPGLERMKGRAVFSGLSPRESEWEEVFRNGGTRELLIAKYDLWPGALRAALRLGIRITVINAEPRSSLWLMSFLAGKSGRSNFRFFVNHECFIEGFRRRFPGAEVLPGCDPRFERVSRRIERESDERVRNWRDRIRALPSPRGILGSAWLEDLERVLPALRGRSDSLVVVPHDLSLSNLERMKRQLEEALPGRYLLVDVMGVLVELYPLADWAFVGGGFGKGIHSTVEPSVSGLRIACGPVKVERFPETRELIEQGILRICRNEVEIAGFIKAASPGPSVARPDFIRLKRDQYRRLLESCLLIR